MSVFLSELGRRAAERWAALLVLPGLLFTAAAATAAVLGQSHWSDTALLRHRAAQLTAPTTVVLLAGLVLSVGSALVARTVGRWFELLLAGHWPGPARRVAARLTARRHAAWRTYDLAYEAARDRGEDDRLGELAARRNRVSLTEPRLPTWTGDRLNAPARRIRKEYALDLPAAWPRLWLLLPDSTRQPLTEARQQFDEAIALGGWAALYTALGVRWWPAAVVGACVALAARQRTRATADTYAELVEAAVDVHLGGLLDRFDDETRPVRPQRGAAASERFRKAT